MKKKIIFLTLFLLILTFLFSGTVLAQRKLELNYPSLPKIGAIQAETKIEQFLAYFYHLLISIAGFIALGVMIYGGALWLTSGGNPTKIAEARERILSGFVGLIILLGSYLILYTINPRLTILSVKIPEPKKLEERLAGVYFCKKDCPKEDFKCITNPENCARLESGPIPLEYQGRNLKGIHFLRPANFPYFYLLLFSDRPGQNQKCSVMLGENYLDGSQIQGEVSPNEATYIMVGNFPGYQPVKGGVNFCERVEVECEKGKIWGPYSPVLGRKDMLPDLARSPLNGSGSCGGALCPVRAMRMEGEFLVVLFQETNYKGNCYYSFGNEPQLGADFIFDRDENGSPYAQVGSLIMIPLSGAVAEIAPGSKAAWFRKVKLLKKRGIEIKEALF